MRLHAILLAISFGGCNVDPELDHDSTKSPVVTGVNSSDSAFDLTELNSTEGNSEKCADKSGTVDPETKFKACLAGCYAAVGTLPWEDENRPGDAFGGDNAFNCRDFTKWFILCMKRRGYDLDENNKRLFWGLEVRCKKCDSRKDYAHRIVFYKRPGKEPNYIGKPPPDPDKPEPNKVWCPGEPQKEDGGEWGDCCRYEPERAAKCALDQHCKSYGARDACCVGSHYTWVKDFECEKEMCRWETETADSRPVLRCLVHDAIGVEPGDGMFTPPSSPRPPVAQTACQKEIKKCLSLKKNEGKCHNCKKHIVCRGIQGPQQHSR